MEPANPEEVPLLNAPLYSSFKSTDHRGVRKVLIISDSLVARLPANWKLFDDEESMCDFEDILLANFIKQKRILQHAYDAGMPVPRPIGVYRLRVQESKRVALFFRRPSKTPLALIVERIHGIPFVAIQDEEDLKEAEKQRKEWINKIWKAGILADDTDAWGNSRGNVLWVQKEKKIYFVDTNQWEFR